MSLLSSHYLVDDNYLITRIKEYGIPIGHMHPVAFYWHSEPLYISVCMRMVGKPIYMFAYNTAIFLRQGYKEFDCPFRDFYFQKITSLKDQDPSLPGSTTPSFPLHRSHRDQQ
jgi:hypothetical protein